MYRYMYIKRERGEERESDRAINPLSTFNPGPNWSLSHLFLVTPASSSTGPRWSHILPSTRTAGLVGFVGAGCGGVS